MNPVFYSGTLTREEMEREHPLELAELEARGARGNAANDSGPKVVDAAPKPEDGSDPVEDPGRSEKPE